MAQSRLVLATLATLVLCATAEAGEDNRFALSPSDDGYLKLDTKTGAVSLCERTEGTFACRLVPDDRDALQAEIERLSDRVKELETTAKAPVSGDSLKLPTDEDMDRVFSFMEKSFKRLRKMVDPKDPAADRI